MKLQFHSLLLLGVTVLFMLACTMKNDSGVHVYWLGSNEFEKQKAGFKLTPEAARTLLVARLKAKHGEWRKRLQLLAIVDDCYLFGAGEKASLSLTGYYVQGRGETVEFRRTNLNALNHGQQPKAAKVFEEAEAL